MPTPVPRELVEAARDGGPAQIERLVEAIWPDAYRLARAILGEQQGAEDAAQEACIILYRTIASLRSAAAFRVGSIASWFARRRSSNGDGLERNTRQNQHQILPIKPRRWTSGALSWLCPKICATSSCSATSKISQAARSLPFCEYRPAPCGSVL